LDKGDLIPGGQGSVRDMAILFNYILKILPAEKTAVLEKSI